MKSLMTATLLVLLAGAVTIKQDPWSNGQAEVTKDGKRETYRLKWDMFNKRYDVLDDFWKRKGTVSFDPWTETWVYEEAK